MVVAPLQIGPVRLSSNLLLAPIAGHCDLAFRLVCRAFNDDPVAPGGLGLACTDLLSPHGLLRGTRESMDLARTNDEDKPIGMQLYGSCPEIMAEGAARAGAHGATVVDINMGCPVDKVCKKDGGSKLMRERDRAVAIAARVRGALPGRIPLTAKMRLGWSESDFEAGVACDLAIRLIDAGVAAITVHGRTTEQRFRGACRPEGIRRVVEAVEAHTGPALSGGVPVIGNGDVRDGDDATRMIEQTGCAGVMIGRGALGAPWIFRDVWARLRSGVDAAAPDEDRKLEMIREYFDLMRRYRGDRHALHQITKRISWFAKHINGSHCRPLKEAIRTAREPDDVYRAIDAWRDGRPSGPTRSPRAARGGPPAHHPVRV